DRDAVARRARIRNLDGVRPVDDEASVRIDRQEAQHVGAIGVGAVLPVRDSGGAAAAPARGDAVRDKVLRQRTIRRTERNAIESRADRPGLRAQRVLRNHLPVEEGRDDFPFGRDAGDLDDSPGDAGSAAQPAEAAEAHAADDVIAGQEVVLEEREGVRLRLGGRAAGRQCEGQTTKNEPLTQPPQGPGAVPDWRHHYHILVRPTQVTGTKFPEKRTDENSEATVELQANYGWG